MFKIGDRVVIESYDPMDGTFDPQFNGMVGEIVGFNETQKYPVSVKIIGAGENYAFTTYGTIQLEFSENELELIKQEELEEDLYI